MKGQGIRERLQLLRTLVEVGRATPESHSREQNDQALAILDEIARLESLPPRALQKIPQVRRSLADFYNLQFNRSWTRRYLLDDIAELERLSATRPEDETQASSKSLRHGFATYHRQTA